jgi:hypothetical protein
VRFDWTAFYLAGRKLGLQPSEFWDMTLPEFFAEMDAIEDAPVGLPKSDVDHFKAWMEGKDV